MSKPLVMLLAGGGGTRLGVLVGHRSKPSVPFAGSYRIIDFALSNVMQAGLDWVGVLTQYKPLSLMSHIGTGEAWNFHGRRRGVRILPPRTGSAASDWYRGTADAIWQSMDFMDPLRPERVLVLSGDHIYRMDYRRMLDDHLARGADVTVAVMQVSARDTSRFGMVQTGPDDRIVRFEEKPAQTDSRLASMGIYLFEWPCLVEALAEFVGRRHLSDFGKDIMPNILGSRRMIVHRFAGYWRDVGTISSLYEANMDALVAKAGLDLDGWEVCTRDDGGLEGDRPPARFGSQAKTADSIVSAGCRIDGDVQRAVISPGVTISEGSHVEEAVLMTGVTVAPGAYVRRAIVDKDVHIGAGARVEGAFSGMSTVVNTRYAKCDLDGIVLVGKGARIPDGVRLGANVVVESGAGVGDFPEQIPEGSTVGRFLQS